MLDIKENIKSKLIKTGSRINDKTPFSRYAKFIKNIDNTTFRDSFASSLNCKDKTIILTLDDYLGANCTNDLSSLKITDLTNITNTILNIEESGGTISYDGIFIGSQIVIFVL